MTTTYRLYVNDLTVDLLNSIKKAFKDKTAEITGTDEVNGFWKAEEEGLCEDYHKKKGK